MLLARSSTALTLSAVCMALAGCPGPSTPVDTGSTADAGSDAPATFDGGGTDAGVDAPEPIDTGADTGVPADDAPSAADAPSGMDSGVIATWTDCREAVVFGAEGEPCDFTGGCVECLLVVSPRQVLCMSGRLRTAAAGPGACAGGTDAGGITLPDAGPVDAGGVDGGGVCPPLVIPAPTAPACSTATVTCIRDGGDPATCITGDAACLSCVQTELSACATSTGGCAEEAGAARCCFDANCPDGSCAETTCAAPWDAYVACFQAAPCSIGDVCFPSAPACPPAAWPAPAAAGCTAATRTCIEGATTSMAFQACLDADTASVPAGESCNACINDDLLSCATATGGCDDELGLVQCCFDAACPAGDAACVNGSVAPGGACATDWSAFVTCANDSITSGACGLTLACFP